MLGASQRVSSQLRLIIACWALASMISAQAASAATIFYDNFNDHDAQDGMPVTWTPGPGTWDASSGDYVATGSLPRVARVLDHVLGDTSARTQARVVGNVEAILAVRRTMFDRGYAGVIRPDGTMAIAKVDGAVPVTLSSAVVPFNPVQQDVMLQFDAFGDKLSLWAWPVGDPMPAAPQVVAFDGAYPEGPAGLVSAGFAGGLSDTTTFRFIHVANTHISGPSTFVLGDFTGDGIVSSADLASWKSGFGTISNATLAQGDADGDHDVDGADFLAWQQQLGGGVASSEPPRAVPEPSSLLLLGVAAASKCRRNGGRRLT